VLLLIVLFPGELDVAAPIPRIVGLRLQITLAAVLDAGLERESRLVPRGREAVGELPIIEVMLIGNRRVLVVEPVEQHIRAVDLLRLERATREIVAHVVEEIVAMNRHGTCSSRAAAPSTNAAIACRNCTTGRRRAGARRGCILR